MSPIFTIPTWTEENRYLHDAICQARASEASANSLQQLLQLNKDKFLNLLDNEPRNPSDRNILNSNKAYINRTSHNVTKEFVTKALFISDQLDINEHVAATLLMRGTAEFSRVSSNSIDTAVLLYHGERGYLLACLDVILKSAKDSSISEEIRTVCSQFIAELLREQLTLSNGTTGTFVSKLLITLENLSKTIDAIIKTGSISGQMPEAGSGKLGEDISELRIERLGDERVYIVQILYHIISLFNIEANDKISMLKLLEEAELSDTATAYMIIALLSALSNSNQPEESILSPLTLKFIDDFHQHIMTHGSKVPVIKAVIILQWILYLSDPVRINQVIGTEHTGRSEADIQKLLDFCITTDVFRFMNEYLLYFQQPNAMIDTDRQTIKQPNGNNDSSSKTINLSDYHNFNADIRNEFQPFVIYELERMSVSIISILSNTLQKLKYKEEDSKTIVEQSATVDNTLANGLNEVKQCHDLEYFLSFLASIFRNRVNEGLIFWNREQGGLHHFVRWLLDIKVPETVNAAFDFFSSIAVGDVCALNVFHFFKLGMDLDLASSHMFSWGRTLSVLQHYTLIFKNNSESEQRIPAVETELILKFLGILKQCVQYCVEARKFFWENETIRLQTILFDLLNCPTSTTLRAAIFDILSAFCSDWGGGIEGVGRRISYQMWKIMENSDMLVSKRKVLPDKSQSITQPAGILQELEFEKSSRVYTETLSVIRLIGSAIHTQSKREALLLGFRDPESSIPLDLGKGTKNPGAIPFISLVIDEIFVNLGTYKYNFAEARWELTDACLMVMENSVESLNIKQFESLEYRQTLDKELKPTSNNSSIASTLLGILTHPGFQVIIRILSGGRIIDEIFNTIEECAKKETKDVDSMPYHKKCLLRSLRLLLRILKIQNTFCNILIPYIVGFSKKKTSSEFQLGEYVFDPLPSVVPLGQLILFHSNILKRIALLVNYEDQEEVCFLSTKILSMLCSVSKDSHFIDNQALSRSASSTSFFELGANMTKALSSYDEAQAIIFGISERLSINIPEVTTCDDYEYDINTIPFWLAEETLGNTYNYSNNLKPRINLSVRIAILDMLLKNIQQSFSPTLTEFLLSYDLSNKNPLNKIQDTEANQASMVCFHAILNMLRQGIHKNLNEGDAMVEDMVDSAEPLIDTHPILAEKCYELIYRLCAKKSLSISTMRYLRNRENFFYKQFDTMASRIEHNIQTDYTSFPGVMICADGAQYKTDFFKLRSKLHQRAWLLKSIALELHTTVAMRQKSETNKLLELLYGRKDTMSEDAMDVTESSSSSNLFANTSTHLYEQPLVKMLELVSSLEFTWVDGLLERIKTSDLKYFSDLSFGLFEIENEHGCQVYDVRKIYKVLKERRDQCQPNSPDLASIELEMESILLYIVAQNHSREIAYAKLHCLKAWKQVIQITLIECFDLILPKNREVIIYELLTMLLPKVTHTTGYDSDMLKNMSEIIVTLVNQLRKNTPVQSISQLPIEKFQTIFNGITNCIFQKETTVTVRGDMYSAITSFLLYIRKHERDESFKQFEQFIINLITLDNAKLLNIICSDAVDGLDIWKTTAYIALDALNTMALHAGNDIVQSFIIEKNFLQYTIDMIRSDDAALSNLLEQTDAPLLPLYIFEARMSILLRLAMNPKGAELLYNHRIFEIFGQCQFTKAQQHDPTLIDMDIDACSELSERYQQLIMPTLKLIVAILCSYDGKNDQVLLKTESWARRQQSTLVNIIRYKHRRITLNLLEQLKLVTTILYYMSCRKGYSEDFIKRGINQLHSSMIQLEIPDNLASTIIPSTNQERIWNKTPDNGNGYSSLLEAKAAKIITSIKYNLDVYKSRK
ncbi:nucleoporin Nup186/Nup192/Nup205 [Cokeromyces recurvatus]|uniref:nucleoporin Nup186/Nup192/Nup205 n=1 Tax=Cokeromyces recurvatus TaxID=90255 RepID=UPI0022202324|nr:nucleoporin Nup186/Nup192/Nup205 [Cokeromyces recurvatus]KAI7906401.1 nucleoporin Nup186/Nup192/Nup205 [Cokeromyces recurvatus]